MIYTFDWIYLMLSNIENKYKWCYVGEKVKSVFKLKTTFTNLYIFAGLFPFHSSFCTFSLFYPPRTSFDSEEWKQANTMCKANQQ